MLFGVVNHAVSDTLLSTCEYTRRHNPQEHQPLYHRESLILHAPGTASR